jgi:dynactin 4
MTKYRSRVEIVIVNTSSTGGGDADAEFMRHIENAGEVTTFEQGSTNGWAMPLQTQYVLVG